MPSQPFAFPHCLSFRRYIVNGEYADLALQLAAGTCPSQPNIPDVGPAYIPSLGLDSHAAPIQQNATKNQAASSLT